MNARGIERHLTAEGFTMVMGDVNLEYGQTWLREYENEGVFDVVEIVDLDGAAGCEGQLLVTARQTWLPHGLSCNRATWLGILECMEVRSYLPAIAKQNKKLARLVMAEACASYGWSDPAGYGISEFIALDWEPHYHSDEYEIFDEEEKYTVIGFGWAAVLRAVENAIAMCESSMTLPNKLRSD